MHRQISRSRPLGEELGSLYFSSVFEGIVSDECAAVCREPIASLSSQDRAGGVTAGEDTPAHSLLRRGRLIVRVPEPVSKHPCSPSKDSSAKCICRCASKFTHSSTPEPSVHGEVRNNLAVGGKSVFLSPPVVQTVTRNYKVLGLGDARCLQ